MTNLVSSTESLSHPVVFSIGHSNVDFDRFLLLLALHEADVVIDVRSQPFSRLFPHFNRKELSQALLTKGLQYLYFGEELGGRPRSNDYYDAEGYVLYSSLSRSEHFNDGIRQIERMVKLHRIVLMCSEEDPKNCHRRLLVSRVLGQRNIETKHIRANGRIQTESDLQQEEDGPGRQLRMFGGQEDSLWRSIRPIRLDSLKGGPKISSEP